MFRLLFTGFSAYSSQLLMLPPTANSFKRSA